MKSRRCFIDVFIRHYRDGIQRKHKNKLYNLSFFSFQRPKNNRRMKSRRCFIDVFMGCYRDGIQRKT